MTDPVLSARELEILQHALGADQYGRRQGDRNHFCAGGDDVVTCSGLVALGLMRTFTREWLPYYNCMVTRAGESAMLAQSPRPPRLTRSQQRYRQFLHEDTGISFGEWLKLQTWRRREGIA